MTATSHSFAATLHFDTQGAPAIWDLAAPACWALRKMGTTIYRQDAALTDGTISLYTSYGKIRLADAGLAHQSCGLTVDVLTGPDSAPSVARDLCRHLVRHFSTHFAPRAVFWHPTIEMADPYQRLQQPNQIASASLRGQNALNGIH